MKTLILLRHAKSSWDDPAARDFDRPLNKRGHRAARAMGRALKEKGLGFDAVVASPAARVVETLAGLADGYGGKIEADYDARLYPGASDVLLQVVHEAPEAVERLLLIGHNPGLEALALLLTRADRDGLRAEMADKYPTAALAEIAFPASSWHDVAPGTGKLACFIRPRDLDPGLGPDD